MTPKDLAEFLRIDDNDDPYSVTYRLRKQYNLGCVKIGHKVLFPLPCVLDFISLREKMFPG